MIQAKVIHGSVLKVCLPIRASSPNLSQTPFANTQL